MIRFLRENVYAAAGLLILRLYLGWEWMTAGWHKITGEFDASGFIKGAIGKATGDHPAVQSWWANFLEGVALPNADLFSFMVKWGEFLVGLGLLLGCLTTAAVFFGMMMNFAFMFSGTTSTNPQMVLLSIFIIVAGYNAGKFGLDYYVIPYLRNWFNKVTHKGSAGLTQSKNAV
jgi:thiosulfate dehydrogenase [quinone] large subunit